jgi:hypothetical protein
MIAKRPNISYAILLIWLIVSLGGMHGHYCFDGKEPPMSVHFDLVDADDENHNDSGHKDYDNKPLSSTLVKLFDLDMPFLFAALLVLALWPISRSTEYAISKTPLSWLNIVSLRPPLRAPPTNSH